MKTYYEEFLTRSPEHFRLMRQEELIVEAVDALAGFMQDDRIQYRDLAARLGVSRAAVSRVFSGDQNLTLRTLADYATALGLRVKITCERDEMTMLPPLPSKQARP